MLFKILLMLKGLLGKLSCLVFSLFRLEFFKHDNIIRLLDIMKPEARTNYTDIYIITDLMETDLHRVIYSRQELS